ncbi:MAG: hypothetical protein NTV43_13445 [Methylococcales bacterium]|nr:hypothetical protein [Methylococcales bacterium]
MDLKDLFDLHEKLETRINAYWTYWSIAVFAVGGWLFSGKLGLLPLEAKGVSLGTMVFFSCNLAVLWQATKLVLGIRDEIRLKSKEKLFASTYLQNALSEDGLKFRLQITLALHVIIDGVVIWALWHTH